MTFGSTFGRVFSPTFQPKSQAAKAAWSPTDITGCKLWLDFSDANYLFTDAGSTKVSSDGDAIYQVNDKSGNNHHATQSTSGKRPLYKTNIKNGKSIARFDGSDDYMISAFTLIQPTHYYWVGKYTSSGSWGRLFDGRTAKNSLMVSAGALAMEGSKVVQSLLQSDTNFHIFRCLFNGTASKFGNNNSSYGSNIDIGTTNAGGITLSAYISGSYLSANDTAEFIVYDNAISAENEASLLTYLNNKWAIY